MSFNQLTEIDEKIFDNLVSIVNLNIRDNKLTNLPKAVQVLQNIERFDLSNNDLSGYGVFQFKKKFKKHFVN